MALNPVNMVLQRMNWLAQQQAVIAQNVSRMDMPHAKTHVLSPLVFDKSVKPKLSQADSRRTNQTQESMPTHAVLSTDQNINYMDQLRLANEGAAMHQQMASLYSNFNKILKFAMKV